MEKKNLKEIFQPALKFAGVLGTVGGFVGDVLSPLGPVLDYLLYLSIFALIISLVLFLLLPAAKKNLFKTASLTSLFFALIFGVFGQLNKETDNGFMGDNLEFISEFQSSLNIIDAKLDKISDQIEVVDEKLDSVDEKIDTGFENLSELIKTSNPIQNPSSPKDFLVNAYLYKNGGDLNKAESSFNSFFEITGSYKIDVISDFIDVLRNNKGKNFVKSYFQTRENIDDEVFTLFKTINISDKKDILNDIQKLDIDQNLIDFGLLYVTNNGGFWMDLVTLGSQSNDAFMYVRKAIELSQNDARFRSKGIEEISYLIINKQNLEKLIYNQANPYDLKTYIQFYFDTIQVNLSSYTSSMKVTEKSAFLGHFAASAERVNYPSTLEADEYEGYYVEKFGEKFVPGQAVPREDGLKLWDMYFKSREFYKNL